MMAARKTVKPAASEQAVEQNENQAVIENKFSKEQLLASKKFQGKRDIVNALLSPDDNYTVETVEQMIENYMKGQVK